MVWEEPLEQLRLAVEVVVLHKVDSPMLAVAAKVAVADVMLGSGKVVEEQMAQEEEEPCYKHVVLLVISHI